ncbi:related to pigp_human [Ramularia collo-cygni]|uniref:Related to pigp_human n=1 Tax=Ramularia collo-cygni TaxID=112498 RepID=A0A2D3UVN4_9PEZI|nr:related to pigp_human [Ramularia collo-cygni]CZT21802.1 related to pigp_human [Ramularia collo-cygni]
MPPQSRGTPLKPPPVPSGFQSKSTPNLPTLRTRDTNPSNNVSDSPDAPGEAFALNTNLNKQSRSPASSEVDSGEDEDGHVPSLPRRPLYHHHSRSHTHLAPLAFAPPFYNRPPTPLPPSPSLTSLLRPNFSSQNSRPATPDPSSDEGTVHTRGDATGTQTPNSAAASTLTSTFRSAKPIPRASPKVPTYEYYGFTLYMTSSLAFIVYLLWAFLPSPFLHQLGIEYYPNRWWALAIPAWSFMLVVYIYVALASFNVGYLTLPLQSTECLVDEAANVAVIDESGKIIRNDRASWRSPSPDRLKQKPVVAKKGKNGGHSRQSSLTKVQTNRELDWRSMWNEGTDAVMDIPIGGVCEILYGGAASDDDTLCEYEQ